MLESVTGNKIWPQDDLNACIKGGQGQTFVKV